MKTFNTVLALKKDWRLNVEAFLKLLDYHLQNDITPMGDLSPPIEIESELCKEIHWDTFVYVAQYKSTETLTPDELNALWDSVCESLNPPKENIGPPYLLKVDVSHDGLCVRFRADTI